MAGLIGCGSPGGATPVAGPACVALRQAAQRAARCDDVLPGLADAMDREADEGQCIVAARALLAPARPLTAPLRSVYDHPHAQSPVPLSAPELAALASLALPATLVLSPDVGNVPGIPPTLASVDGLALDHNRRGQLATDVAAGAHTVHLRHAGKDTVWCVQLAACQTLEVVAHGAQLAHDPQVAPGECRQR